MAHMGAGQGKTPRSEGSSTGSTGPARPSVVVEVAVLTVVGLERRDGGVVPSGPPGGGEPEVRVLLCRRGGRPRHVGWGLPASTVREEERLGAAVVRTLTDTYGIEGREAQQLHVFDEPGREDPGWTLVVAHVVVVPAAALVAAVTSRDDLTLAPIHPPGEAVEAAEIADVIRFPAWAVHANHPTLDEWDPDDADPDLVGRAALASALRAVTQPGGAGRSEASGARSAIPLVSVPAGPDLPRALDEEVAATLLPLAELYRPRPVVRLPDGQAHLPFDQDQIVRLALERLRASHAGHPDPERLLGEPFTLRALRRLHEAVSGEPLQKDTFRRQVRDHLVELDEYAQGAVGRPARLYRHRDG